MAKVQKQQWTKDQKNVGETRSTTLRGMAKNKAFNQGYNDYKRGIWAKDYDLWPINDQWRYERGRHYAAAGGPAIKESWDGRVIRNQALWFMSDMLDNRSMI